jgi:peptide/nickel transport system substrate-binding protein
MQSYWEKLTSQRRLSRRDVLRGSAGLGIGAAALGLIGCGGNDGNEITGDQSGLLGSDTDSTKEAVAGGTWPAYRTDDLISTDPILNTASPAFSDLVMVYSTLLKAGFAVDKKPGSEATTGDAAESFELTPDATQLTLKLRQNHKFDPKPPTNGRAMDSADVKYSWERFEKNGASARDLAYSRGPAAPIESISTPDARMVVFKLAFPCAAVTDLLASQQHFYVMPKETDEFNSKAEMRGSAPISWTSTSRAFAWSIRRTRTGTTGRAPSSTPWTGRSSPTTRRGWRSSRRATSGSSP